MTTHDKIRLNHITWFENNVVIQEGANSPTTCALTSSHWDERKHYESLGLGAGYEVYSDIVAKHKMKTRTKRHIDILDVFYEQGVLSRSDYFIQCNAFSDLDNKTPVRLIYGRKTAI